MTGAQQSQEPGRKVKNGPHWLDRYATPFHDWTSSHTGGRTTYQRPLGLVELSFDADGVHYGGRADMTATLTLALSHSLSPTEFRHTIAAAWTALRLRHVLLMSRCIESTDSSSSFPGALRRFSIDLPGSEEEAVQETLQDGIVWVEDFYGAEEVNPRTLHDHALNVGRIVDPAICLSKLLVLPVRQKEDGTSELSLLVIMGHQISDGLSAYSWFSDLIRLLNLTPSTLSAEIHSALQPSIFSTRLPPAQESLYPAVKGSRARQRWIWAILRVLRHVQHTLPPSFSNPLYRPTRLKTARPLPQTYPKLFSYSPASLPPNSTGHINATLSPAASARMQTLCRSASLSIGAGCFALAGLAMMDIHSTLSPSSSPSPAMTASFPLNPRSFFTPSPSPDSCMLSFSDGIVLGHTSSSLPITSRFLLTARLANRELRAYQKRGRQTSLNAGGAAAFDRHAPARLLATGYLAQIERVVARGSETARQLGFVGLPQGELEAKKGPMATCGVSSVGSLKGFFRAGEYDLGDASKDFVVDYRGLRMGVRAREGEFLIGSSTDGEGRVGFGVSYDASAIDPEKAELWARTITGLLEESKAKL